LDDANWLWVPVSSISQVPRNGNIGKWDPRSGRPHFKEMDLFQFSQGGLKAGVPSLIPRKNGANDATIPLISSASLTREAWSQDSIQWSNRIQNPPIDGKVVRSAESHIPRRGLHGTWLSRARAARCPGLAQRERRNQEPILHSIWCRALTRVAAR